MGPDPRLRFPHQLPCRRLEFQDIRFHHLPPSSGSQTTSQITELRQGETMVMVVGCLVNGESNDQRMNTHQLSGDGTRKARFIIYMGMIHLLTATALQHAAACRADAVFSN